VQRDSDAPSIRIVRYSHKALGRAGRALAKGRCSDGHGRGTKKAGIENPVRSGEIYRFIGGDVTIVSSVASARKSLPVATFTYMARFVAVP
jgi:hypothetical protein